MAKDSNSIKIATEFIKSKEGLASASPNLGKELPKNSPDNTNVYAYWDKYGKVWTIGWGTVYKPDGTMVKQGEIITKKQADDYIYQLVAQKAAEVKKFVDTSKMSDNQFAALISIAYNAGSNGLKNSPIIPAIKEGKSPSEIASVISDSLVKSKGVVVQGLINRRKEEASLYLKDSGKSGSANGKLVTIAVILILAVGLSYFIYTNIK